MRLPNFGGRRNDGWSNTALVALTAFSVGMSAVRALTFDVSSEESIKSAASNTIYGMMTYYHGNESGQIPGSFPTKWWEGAPLFMALLQYWHFTGDSTYNDELSLGLEWQSGTNGDYMPKNYSAYLGNDDQMFWGVAAMTAAEVKFPDRHGKGEFSWLSLAQGVFNTQVGRWDNTTCGGGLRWQIYAYEGGGYLMKNSIANGGLFQLAARLHRYTGDKQYSDWANKIWDWSQGSPLVNNKTWNIADSTNCPDCNDMGNGQWSYNYGTFLMGCAYMANVTTGSEQQMWQTRTEGILGKLLGEFFPDKNGGIFEEITCEQYNQCNLNEILFKGVTSSWLSFTALLVPKTYDQITKALETTATAAAKSCSGKGTNACGIAWSRNKWDGTTGMEQQISASDVFVANLVRFPTSKPGGGGDSFGPVTSKTGGDSKSDPNAGKSDTDPGKPSFTPITTGDRAGAGILTALILAWWLGGVFFVVH